MKKIIFSLFMVFTISLFAQDWNDISIEITPENPNMNDEIVISVSGQTTSNVISINTSYAITENGTIVVQTEVYQGGWDVVDYFNAENNIGSLAVGSYGVEANVDYFFQDGNGNWVQFDNKQETATFEVTESIYNQTLFGYVNSITEDGITQPIAGAIIRIEQLPDDEFVTTNEEGFYEITFDHIWNGPVTVICEAEGYNSETITFFPESEEQELNFELEPTSQDFGFLVGHIGSNVDWYFDDGANIENAFVHVYNAMYEAETYSDDDGNFQFELPPAGGYSSYTISVTAEYYEDTFVNYIEIGAGVTTSVEVAMLPAINLGDVDDNDEIQALDASVTLQNTIGIYDFEEWQIWAADVDRNGQVQAYDASLILQYSVGIIDEFPVAGEMNIIEETNSGCLDFRDEEAFIEISVNGNEMTLFFFHPTLNCGLEADWSGCLENDIFHVEMNDIGIPADCECPFELTVTFGPFESGMYTLDFWNGEFGSPTFTIE